MVAIAELGPENIVELKSKYEKLLKSSDYNEFVTRATTDDKNVQGRIDLALKTLK